MYWFNLISLVIVCFLVLAAYVPILRTKINSAAVSEKIGKFTEKITARQLDILFIIFFLIGTAARLWKFGDIPAGFNQDGAMGAVDALALAHHGTDRFGMWMPVHFTAWGFGQMSVLLSYLSVPFIAVFGLNRITARISVLIVSLLALWVVYLLVKLLVNKKAALAVLAFCAVDPWQMMQSRWALDCNLLPHFLLFSIYFLCLGLKKNSKFIYLSMVFFGITMYSYGIAWYTVPLFLIISCIYLFLKKKIGLKTLSISALIYLLTAWPIFGVIAVNYFKLHSIVTPFFTIPFFPDSRRTADILFFSNDIPKQLISNIKAIINVVFLQKPDLPWNTIPEFGTVYLFSMPLVLAGLIYLFKQKMPIILIWLTVAVISGMIINNINVNRINLIFYPLIIFCGLGIYKISKNIRLGGIVLAVIFVCSSAAFGANYFGPHAKVIGNAFYDGFGEALEYVNDMDYDRIYVTNWTQSENSWWVSEPLTLFHHSIDALYYQGKADSYSKTGKKLLPYADRYKYVQMKDLQKNPGENAVYIANKNEQVYFDSNLYKFIPFGNYLVVLTDKSYVPAAGSNTSSASNTASAYNSSLIIYTVIYISLAVLIFYLIKWRKLVIKTPNELFAILLLLGAALIFRISTAQIIEGWPNDIAANKYWAGSAAQGLSDFYNRGWCDYPPLFIYVLAFIGKLASIPWLQPSFTLLIKLPSILADIVTAYMIFRIAKKQLKSELAILAGALYAFNPAVYIDSTIWGQVDSFFTMIVVAALFLLMNRKIGFAAVFFTAAVLMKPQGIFFLPILLFELIKSRKLMYFAKAAAAGIITAFVIVLPFAINQEPLWIFKLFLGTAGEYPAASMNALNIFSLAGANFVDGSKIPFLFSYNTWGLIFDAIVLGISAYIYFKGRHTATALITAVLLNSGAFIFSVKMHERYMFPVIAISILALVYLKEKRILLIFAGFSATIFLNIHILFYRVLLLDVQRAHLVGSDVYPAVFAISFINVILFCYLVKVSYDILINGRFEYLKLEGCS